MADSKVEEWKNPLTRHGAFFYLAGAPIEGLSCAYLDGIVLLDAGPVDGARELGVPVVAVDHGDGDVGRRAELRGSVVLRIQRERRVLLHPSECLSGMT